MWKWFSESSNNKVGTLRVPPVRNNQILIKALSLRDTGFQMVSSSIKFDDMVKDLGCYTFNTVKN
jgi:hypothetical protein